MDVWYKKLGYYENPFVMNPMKENTPMYGNETQLDDVLYYIKSGSILFVEGAKGTGKTKFLRTVISQFKGRIIYVFNQYFFVFPQYPRKYLQSTQGQVGPHFPFLFVL